jgi:hypothetical protein
LFCPRTTHERATGEFKNQQGRGASLVRTGG